MVRGYILTSREREILERFLNDGEKLNGFSQLLHYLRKGGSQLTEDLRLIEEAIKKEETK